MTALGLKPSGLSNALVPQGQFRAVMPYFTGSAYLDNITQIRKLRPKKWGADYYGTFSCNVCRQLQSKENTFSVFSLIESEKAVLMDQTRAHSVHR
jgi:hypothetical protein